MKNLNFNSIFGNHNDSNSASKKKANKQRRGRTCRFEELEGREMLSATPWALSGGHTPPDVFVDYNAMSGGHTPPDVFQTYTTDVGGLMSPALSPLATAPVIIQNPISATYTPSQAPVSTAWGTVAKTTSSGTQTWKVTSPTSFVQQTGSFTFTLAHSGDANSYIKLAVSVPLGSSMLIMGYLGANTGISLDGVWTRTGQVNSLMNERSILISLDGVEAGTHTVNWCVEVRGSGEVNYDLSVRPPVAVPVITVQPQNASYVVGTTTTPLSVTVNIPSGNSDNLTYQWQRREAGTTLSWTNLEKNHTEPSRYIPAVDSDIQYEYRCIVTNTLEGRTAVSTSNAATVTLSVSTPTISSSGQPRGATYQPGTTPSPLTVMATITGQGTLTYQWFRSDGTAVSAISEDSSFIPPTSSVNGTASYYCIVTNRYLSLSTTTQSDAATITFYRGEDDIYEGNDTPEKAVLLPVESNTRFAERNLVANGVDDWFKFTMDKPGDLSSYVKINYVAGYGNLTLTIHKEKAMVSGDPSSGAVGLPDASAPGEQKISLVGLEADTYYIHVSGVNTGTYSITIEPPKERHDSLATADVLGPITAPTEFGRRIYTDLDGFGKSYYSFELNNPGDIDSLIAIQSLGAQNVTIKLLDSSGKEINTSAGPSFASMLRTIDVFTRTQEGGQTREQLGGYREDYWNAYTDENWDVGLELSAGYSGGFNFGVKATTNYGINWGESWGGNENSYWENERVDYWENEQSSYKSYGIVNTYATFSLNGLAAGLYYIVVDGENMEQGQVDYWVKIGINPPPASEPQIPQLGVTKSEANSITFSWSVDPNSFAERYLLEVKEQGGDWLENVDYTLTQMSQGVVATVTGLKADTGYYILLTAVNNNGMSAPGVLSANTLGNAESETDLTVTSNANNSVAVSGLNSLPAGSVLQFKQEGGEWTTWIASNAENNTTIPGLAAGEYEIQVVDAHKNVSYTQNITVAAPSIGAATAPNALKPKAKVDKKAATINSVTVAWPDTKKMTAQSNTRYVVSCYVKDGKIWREVGEQFSTADRIHTFTGLNPNTSYRVSIAAVNANGEFGTNKKGNKVISVVTVTAKTLKYTAVKVSKPMKFTAEDGTAKVMATIVPPKKVPAGATYEIYNLYLDMGKKADVQFVSVSDFTVSPDGKTLTIDWSELGLDDTASNKFVLRAVTDGVKSADAKLTIKFSTLKTKA